MKTELSKIAKDLEKSTITENEARTLLLGLLSVSKCSWKIGEKVVVTHCMYGHEFDNGTTVEIVDHEPNQITSWLCSDGDYAWWLSEEEGYVF